MHKGSCNCGAVTFTVTGDIPETNACHCTECRKQSGHYGASADIPQSAIKISGEDNLTWFHTSEKVRRGFCKTCGSNMFWDPVFRDWTAIALGAFDTPTNTALKMHIYVAEKGDYYDIKDGLPQNQH